MSSDVKTALSAQQIRVEKIGACILDDISLVLPSGTLSVVAGPNGAGKSTLLRCLAGIEAKHSGCILWQQTDLAGLTHRQRARIVTWLPPTNFLPFDFDVFTMVTIGRFPWHQGMPSKHDRMRAFEALEQIGLSAFAARSLRSLSSGEQQRAFIARALASDAPVLLFDEPCANLDIAAALTVLNLFKALAAAGRTIIMTLHDLSLTVRYADYGVLLKSGRLVAAGHDIFTCQNIERIFQVQTEKTVSANGLESLAFGLPD